MVTFPIGTGHGFMSCPAGAGLLPALHHQGPIAVTAAIKGVCPATGLPVALGGPGRDVMIGAGKAMAVKGPAACATLAGGKGLTLGLGIGLGLWGPAILAGLGAVAAYTLWKSRHTIKALNEDEAELEEALSSR
ncbi:MAG: magnetic particle specific iron-binding protein [Rhodospirillaceae bacterium]